ncbi:type VI secretion system Vgr family protein [Bordetella petrii]|uniref:type VI secretion system Vgr family protein n=1 Tax=Bordetella petrii TaxID=94624 RepID=UPI001A958D58|nr:type VI secretion system Vgr family protein [Bordetella petrii]MBO1112826.1 type VI secretion system tip protein VgrG [Bordetella petrii]
MTSPYDYRLDCRALYDLVPGQTINVTHWRGTEAVSRPYRFEITFAVRQADLALEKLLNQPATLSAHKPDGSVLRWHGIVTQGAQRGADETYDYYQVVLEPRMVRLRHLKWSDIYLNQQLDDIIRQLLRLADLDEPYSSADAPYDYRIAASQLAATRTPFACQFEETCLDFLMRKLEFYGVYFWFEQGESQESVVFANNVDQQPSDADSVVYYPKGVIDPDAREVALTRLNRRVSLHPGTVTLHDSNDLGNTTLSLASSASVPAPTAGFGEVHLAEDHFETLQDENSVAGATLAIWRGQELACERLRIDGEARTPGVCAGRIIEVSEYLRGTDPGQYYVIEITHEGTQTLETAPETDAPAYVARFMALPRWQDIGDSDRQPLQFRPARVTAVPIISRLVNGFVDIDTPNEPKQYAQPDDDGRYKVRFSFPRQRYAGNQNSAWLRMATPYAGGAATSGLGSAGMHFPLREGTEVLIAFLNGNPDRPVIMSTLPNVESPSVVNAQNSADHVIRTPSGNVLAMTDASQSASSDGENTGLPGIYLGTNTASTSLNLGAAHDSSMQSGFNLTTSASGHINADGGMVIEVPGHLKIAAGSSGAKGVLSKTVQGLPSGISVGENMGIVVQNFLGVRIIGVEGISVNNHFGGKLDMMELFSFLVTLGVGKQIHLLQKKVVNPNSNYATAALHWVAGQWKNVLLNKQEKAGNITVLGLESIKSVTPDYSVKAGSNQLSMTPIKTSLSGAKVELNARYVNVQGLDVAIKSEMDLQLKADDVYTNALGISMTAVQNVRVNAAKTIIMGEIIQLG